MNYGYFDEANREYVITKPNTPAPWCNYLGSPAYGAIISNNAGGYSFEKSGAKGRILRYRFNADDKPGRYIYIRDDETKDYWSASWQPVGKDLDTYKSECHHGTGYTNMMASYAGIDTSVLYYVPKDKTYEVWNMTIKNTSDRVRKLSTFGFAEFTNDSNYEQDQVNLQYTLFITKTYFKENKILQVINESCKKYPINGNSWVTRFFGQAGADVTSYNGDKAAFIGRYRSYGNPQAVENGVCDNALNYNTNGCGALHSVIELQPGEEKVITYVLGMKNAEEADEIIKTYQSPQTALDEVQELKDYWHGKLNNFVVHTPDPAFNNMVNTWNAYQCFMTVTWSRAASFVYCGQRNGYGYRDTVQDTQGITHLDTETAGKHLRFMLSAQVDNGGGMPLVKYDHNPGHEPEPDDNYNIDGAAPNPYRADDALWLFPTVYKYIGETGDKAFLDEVIPYSNKGEGTVYEHLQKAIEFSENRLGVHKMPAGLHADWNDCLRLGKAGESSFVAMQLYYGISILKEFAAGKNDTEYIKYLDGVQDRISKTINDECWDDDRFIRGFTEDGQIIGAKKDLEASMWLNPQSWAVISGVASKERCEQALEKVHEELNTKYGVRIMAPSFKEHAFKGALALLFNPSTKENGGVFSQAQGWIILAESLMGHGNRAFEYFTETSPATQNDNADVRCLEPYVHGQFTESVESPYEGRSHVHWLTGTATTIMVSCIEGICGMRPDPDGLWIAPAIPSEWKEMKMEKVFRGCKINITVKNENGAEGGFKEFYLNGKKLDKNYVAEKDMQDVNEVLLVM